MRLTTPAIFAHVLQAAERLVGVERAAAHCDLPCGVYDPAQARIEAESVHKIMELYQESDDAEFRQRAILIKEERAELVKHHLWVLWTDYFTPEHLSQHPDLHDRVWQATKLAGEAKHTTDPKVGVQLLDAIAEIDKIFWDTKLD